MAAVELHVADLDADGAAGAAAAAAEAALQQQVMSDEGEHAKHGQAGKVISASLCMLCRNAHLVSFLSLSLYVCASRLRTAM